MLVTNIQTDAPSQVMYNHITFDDPEATANETLMFLEKVSVEIESLQFQYKSAIPPHLGKIKKLKKLTIENAAGEELTETIFSIPIEQLKIMSYQKKTLPLSIFQNESLEMLSLQGEFEILPHGDYHLPKLTQLSLNSTKLNEIPIGQHHLPCLKKLELNKSLISFIPDAFFETQELEVFLVESPNLQHISPKISSQKNLRYLKLNAPLTSGLPNLLNTNLHIAHFLELKGTDYRECQLPLSLNNVILKGAKSETVYLPDLRLCTNLKQLYLENSVNYPSLASNLSHLNTFSAKNVEETKLPAGLETAMLLKKIDIFHCPILEFPVFLTKFTELQSLHLRGIQAREFPEDWSKCQALTGIIIHSSNLIVNNLDFVADLKNIGYIELIGTKNTDKYSLISKRKSPLSQSSTVMLDCKFQTVNYSTQGSNKSLKPLNFNDFATALGKTKLSKDDKYYFFDLLWEVKTVNELSEFDFSNFLKALNIGFKPLTKVLQRRLVREVLLQHFVNMKLVKNPVAFEASNPEKFLLDKENKPLVDNVRVFLRNENPDNVRLGLQMLKSGGLPTTMAEEILLIAKTNTNTEVRQDAQEILPQVAPEDWTDLINDKTLFSTTKETYEKGFFTKKLNELAEKIKPKSAAFLGLLLRRKYSFLTFATTEIDEFIFTVAQSLDLEKKLLRKDAVVFVNGTTTLKKTEIKQKLEAINVQYATKYSKKVTHVLIGKNPSIFDIQRSDIQILTENSLQKYLSQVTPDFLEQAEQTGDSEMADNVLQLLESPDANNIIIALEMLKTGGVPKSLFPVLLVLQKTYDDAKVRSTAKKLLERYGPTRWLPLLRSRLIFKSINTNAKETDTYNRLLKIEKETSTEIAAELSLLLYLKYKKGLRFLLKNGPKTGEFHFRGYKAIFQEGYLDISNGVGYTNWHKKGTLDNYYGTTSVANMSIAFPKNIHDLGLIKSINLHNVKIKSLPKNVTKIEELEHLDVSFNGLKSLPMGLKSLKNLQTLDLSHNDFTEFPERVKELKNLKTLDLSNQKSRQLSIPSSIRTAFPNCTILV